MAGNVPATVYTNFVLWTLNNKCYDKFLHTCTYQLPAAYRILFCNLCASPLHRGHAKKLHEQCRWLSSQLTPFLHTAVLTSSPSVVSQPAQNTCHKQSEPRFAQLSVVYSETDCDHLLKQPVLPPLLPTVFLSTLTPLVCQEIAMHSFGIHSWSRFQADHCFGCGKMCKAGR